ncbi:hypothetical protein CAPTEDRAFT_170729 [Capitella teleta]|uniref:BRCA1-associated protein n=1 Tax=Capitella teleta TaxID=283909 RepID=R7UFN0_CAPTE|nr:hypothetical protein CAPTEDRAFT_170729 [Capitella teleta]|eukprot:ELU05344.1 hypothetical protein CAPTEDRAFT_170729 [Capitella teleta]
MPISLAIFRLELANESEALLNFSYAAPEFSVGNCTSYAQAASCSPVTKIHLSNCKGRREYQTFTIETYVKGMAEEAAGLDVDAASTASSASNDRSKLKDLKAKRKSPTFDGQTSSRPGSARSRNRDNQHSIWFYSGNPAVERTEGILHLYKDNKLTSLDEDGPRSEMICILKVPASIMSQDLIQFLAPVQSGLEIIRIIRDSTPSQYMVLLKFVNQVAADEFYKNFNNKSFNSIEEDICYLVYVARLETLSSSEGAALPISGATELPVCTVCLESMDESVEGILTILCNHSFHCSCLAKWGDTTCPICRYIQTPENVTDNCCFQCTSQEELWICLICGHVGCGRYNEGHAHKHFQETNHTYALRLGQNSVWDYAGDNYVHRLVANKTDGKMVELVDEAGNQIQEEKLDSMELEYTYLLTTQLESQRNFFLDEIKMLELKKQKEVEEKECALKKACDERTHFREELDRLMAEKKVLEKKNNQLDGRLTKVLKDYGDELELNRSLQGNQVQYQDEIHKLKKMNKQVLVEKADLEEQIRDLIGHFEAQTRLKESPGVSQQELQDSHIVVSPSTTATNDRKRHRKKPAK